MCATSFRHCHRILSYMLGWLSASSPGDVVGVRLRMLDHMTGLWSSQLLALQMRDCIQYMETSSPLFFNRTAILRNIVDCTVVSNFYHMGCCYHDYKLLHEC